jgi:hypothetical protein
MARIVISLVNIGYEIDAFLDDNHDGREPDAVICRDFGGDIPPDVSVREIFEHLTEFMGTYEQKRRKKAAKKKTKKKGKVVKKGGPLKPRTVKKKATSKRKKKK